MYWDVEKCARVNATWSTPSAASFRLTCNGRRRISLRGRPRQVSRAPARKSARGVLTLCVRSSDGAASVMTSATTAGSSGPQKSGWDAFEFSRSVLAGIKRMGYKLPTPIQKATLRVALSGKDVVAMARTGAWLTMPLPLHS